MRGLNREGTAMSSLSGNHNNNTNNNPEPSAAMIAIAAELGISVEEAVARFATPTAPAAPTVAKHIESYLAKQRPNTRRTYGTHLDRLRDGIGPICDQECAPCMDRANGFVCRCTCSKCSSSRITVEPQGALPVGPQTYTSDHVAELAEIARRVAVKSGVLANQIRAERGLTQKPAQGHNASETAVHALRSLYKSAMKAYLGDVNPGLEVARPRRSLGSRRPMQDYELMELQHLTATGGDDPELDELLFDFGLNTGARRLGAINQTVGRIHRTRQMIGIVDKYDRVDDIPVSLQLIDRLMAHAISRGGAQCDPSSSSYRPNSPVFWRRSSAGYQAITSRRFDTLIRRWQASLPFANEERVGYHHLRHTMGAEIDKRYGTACKSAFLRHIVTDTTGNYGTCSPAQLAAALADLFKFEHPLVHGSEKRRRDTMKRFGLDSD